MCQLTSQIRDTLIQAVCGQIIELRLHLIKAKSDSEKAIWRAELRKADEARQFLMEQTA
jgi:hypothetical protein